MMRFLLGFAIGFALGFLLVRVLVPRDAMLRPGRPGGRVAPPPSRGATDAGGNSPAGFAASSR